MYRKEYITKYPEYQVDTEGMVYGKDRNPLSPALDKKGYLRVSLSINGVQKMESIHRLVAMQFIPNDDTTKTQVNHKNGRKADNRVENLEWVTPQENIRHSIYVLGADRNVAKRKAIVAYNDTEEYKFESITETAIWLTEKLGKPCAKSNISVALSKGKSAYGYRYKYITN